MESGVGSKRGGRLRLHPLELDLSPTTAGRDPPPRTEIRLGQVFEDVDLFVFEQFKKRGAVKVFEDGAVVIADGQGVVGCFKVVVVHPEVANVML